ncbi:MAG: transposase [Cyanobacteria bacterium P01_H01_bin.15]
MQRSQASSSSKLIELYREQLPRDRRVLLAGDNTAWSRLWSPTLRDRTYEHQPQGGPESRPVTLGQGYCSLVCVPEEQGSWVLPVLHERISSFEKPWEKAAMQLKQVCQQLNERPISLWDSAFGCASFVLRRTEIPCDNLMRMKSNWVVYGPPPEYGGRGRPRKHGKKFKLNEPSTWRPPPGATRTP